MSALPSCTHCCPRTESSLPLNNIIMIMITRTIHLASMPKRSPSGLAGPNSSVSGTITAHIQSEAGNRTPILEVVDGVKVTAR